MRNKHVFRDGITIASFVHVMTIYIHVSTLTTISNHAKEGECGSGSTMRLRIVGGENAKKAEFPWIISLTRRGGHLCGGTIISEKLVVTAAHCLCTGLDDNFFKPSSINVTLAQHDISEKDSDAFKVAVTDFTVYPGYVCSVPKDDIALLHLEHNIQWSKTVKPACVSIDENRKGLDSSHVTVAGWGWTDEDHSIGKRSNRLLKAGVMVINTDICRAWYKEQKKRIEVLETHLCAGHENGGIDACWADSGGPLMKKIDNENDKTMIVGVVSTGSGCGRFHLPGIYTRISDYISWIDKVIKEKLEII